MASSSHLLAKPSSFFKIILCDVDSHTKLRIPRKFASIHGNNLKDEIFVNVPSGSVWSIKLKRRKNEVWLKNGWPEFAKFYNICFGYLLVFEHQGDSKFQLLIFDPSAVEIDYPPTSTSDNFNTVRSTRSKKTVIDSDDSTSLDVVRPCKRRRTRAGSSGREAWHHGPKLQQEKEQRNGKTASKKDKESALASAKAFKSQNPFFIHVMKSSNVGGIWPSVHITNTFKEAYKKWKNNDKVILQVEGRKWSVYCNMNPYQCRFSRKWSKFVRENSLDVDDVCVFELINRSRKLLQVFIFRAAEETSS